MLEGCEFADSSEAPRIYGNHEFVELQCVLFHRSMKANDNASKQQERASASMPCESVVAQSNVRTDSKTRERFGQRVRPQCVYPCIRCGNSSFCRDRGRK